MRISVAPYSGHYCDPQHSRLGKTVDGHPPQQSVDHFLVPLELAVKDKASRSALASFLLVL